MNCIAAKAYTPLVPVERIKYEGKNMLRDPLTVADPEAYEIMTDVSLFLFACIF